MRVLITGITGFVGSHLAELLLQKPQVDLYGIDRWRSKTDNIDHVKSRIKMYECDVRDASSVRQVLEAVKPDRIIHLAAQSFVPMSWRAPSETFVTNVVGQVNLLEAIRECRLSPRLLVIGSSEEYGLVQERELPITETNALRPLSPYAVSKVAQDLMGFQYAQSYRMHIVRTRAFNHTGPRRGEVFVTSNFAKQIASIEAGLQEPVVCVGNLEARRDFSDVRDIVRGYWLALERGEPGEVYNLCSGKDYSVRQVLDILLGFTSARIAVKPDPQRMRPSDVPVLRGDSTKFSRLTGWRTEIPLETTLADLLNYWRAKLMGTQPPAMPRRAASRRGRVRSKKPGASTARSRA